MKEQAKKFEEEALKLRKELEELKQHRVVETPKATKPNVESGVIAELKKQLEAEMRRNAELQKQISDFTAYKLQAEKQQREASQFLTEKLRLEVLEAKVNEQEVTNRSTELKLQAATEEFEKQKREFFENSEKYREKIRKELQEELQEQEREKASSLTVERLRLTSLEEKIVEREKQLESEKNRIRAEAEALEREKKEFLLGKEANTEFLELQKADLDRISKEDQESFEKRREEFTSTKKEEWSKIEEFRKKLEGELRREFEERLAQERKEMAENFERKLDWNKKKLKAESEKDLDTKEHRQKLALNR